MSKFILFPILVCNLLSYSLALSQSLLCTQAIMYAETILSHTSISSFITDITKKGSMHLTALSLDAVSNHLLKVIDIK